MVYKDKTRYTIILFIVQFYVYRIFKLLSPNEMISEHILHASVLSMVEFDDHIFAAGNCFDKDQYPHIKGLHCPFAHRSPDTNITTTKDLAFEYNYLGNTSEWFYMARRNAEHVIKQNTQHKKGNIYMYIFV